MPVALDADRRSDIIDAAAQLIERQALTLERGVREVMVEKRAGEIDWTVFCYRMNAIVDHAREIVRGMRDSDSERT